MSINKPIIKHDNKYWMLEKIEGDTAILWRDGVRKEVEEKELTDPAVYTNGELEGEGIE